MKLIRLAACCAAGALFCGCESLPKHEVDIYPRLVENPVDSIVILPPAAPVKIDRSHPDDLGVWKDENREATIQYLDSLVREALSSSVTVESVGELDQDVQEWAADIGKDLLKNRVAIFADPVALEAEAVLVWAIVYYGIDLNQISYRFLPFVRATKRRYVGKMSYDHTCELEALLVRPRDGAIFFHVRHEARGNAEKRDPDLLKKLARECAWALTQGLPPP